MKKFVAAITAVFFAVALVLVGAAAPASAHTPALTGAATCDTTTGTWTVTWTYAVTQVPDGVEAESKVTTHAPSSSTITSSDGISKGGQLFFSVWTEHKVNNPGVLVRTGNWTVTYKQSGISASTNHATSSVQTDWKDGVSHDTDGTFTFHGTCAKPDNTDTKVPICHATASNSNPYVTETVSYDSIITPSGHGSSGINDGDIIPPFDYIKDGTAGHYDGQNWSTANQAIYNNGCVVPSPPTIPKDASATLTFSPATCAAAQTVTEGATPHSSWSGAIAYSGAGNLTYTAVAHADSGHQFPDASNVTNGNETKTFTGTLDAQLTEGCTTPGYVIVAWTMPSWQDSTDSTWPQQYYHSLPETSPDLSALDSILALTCDTQYQVDIYHDSLTTTNLISGGFLTSPNHPAEDLITGTWGKAYKLVHTPACPPVIPKDATATASFKDGTCGTPGTLGDHSATNATFEGDAPLISGSDWSWIVDAASGHEFADGSTQETLHGTVPAAIPFQSTDENGPCYVSPPPSPHDANALVHFSDGTCGVAGQLDTHSTINASFDTEVPVILDGTWTWAATADAGHLFVDNGLKHETFSGTVPAAIPFQNTDANGLCYQEPPADASASVTFSDGTCEGPGAIPTAIIANATWTQQTIDTVDSTYDWIATADAGHEFSTGHLTLELQGNLPVQIPSQSANPNGTCYVAPPADAAATVTVTAATCDAPAMLLYGAKTNATFDAAGSTADGATGATVTNFTVVADADAGHAFSPLVVDATTHTFNADADNQPANTIETFTGSLDPQLAHQETDPSLPCFDAPPIAIADPTGSSCQALVADTDLTSWVHVDLNAHVSYRIHAVGTVTDTALTQSYTTEPAGSYVITATADAGWTLAATSTQPAGAEQVWTVNVQDLGECQLPPGATWHANATGSPAVCTSSSTQAGTVTLQHLASEQGEVVYTVTNDSTSAVVYSGRFSTSVKVAPGHYTVHAAPFVSTDGISTATVFHITIAAASTICSTLTTLAFTGATGTMGLFLAGGMLFLGIAGLLMRRRFVHRGA